MFLFRLHCDLDLATFYVSSGLRDFWLCLLWLLDICFIFYLSPFPYVSLMCTVIVHNFWPLFHPFILFISYHSYSTSSLSFLFKKNTNNLIQRMSSDGANCYYISRDSRHPGPHARLQSIWFPLPEPRIMQLPLSSPRSPGASAVEPSESKDLLTKCP